MLSHVGIRVQIGPKSNPQSPTQDAASALLAAEVGADALLLLTDAAAVFDPRKFPGERAPVPSPTSPDALLELGSFSAGSMGPKVGSWVFSFLPGRGWQAFA